MPIMGLISDDSNRSRLGSLEVNWCYNENTIQQYLTCGISTLGLNAWLLLLLLLFFLHYEHHHVSWCEWLWPQVTFIILQGHFSVAILSSAVPNHIDSALNLSVLSIHQSITSAVLSKISQTVVLQAPTCHWTHFSSRLLQEVDPPDISVTLHDWQSSHCAQTESPELIQIFAEPVFPHILWAPLASASCALLSLPAEVDLSNFAAGQDWSVQCANFQSYLQRQRTGCNPRYRIQIP